jgi:hypothetical protein
MITSLLEIGLQNIGFEKSSQPDRKVSDGYVSVVIHDNFNNSTVVICHAETPMLPLGQAEYPDKEQGVRDGTSTY